MFLNASIPHLYCLLRREFLYDQQRGHGEYEPCAVFGVTSIQSRAVMFVAMTERGAQVDRLPVSAFCWKPCPPLPLGVLELWDAFSYDVAVTEFDYLRGLSCLVRGKDRQYRKGEYVLTLDWARSAYAEDAGEGGHKSAHLIRLETGHFSLMPNNRIFWREPSFVTKPLQPGVRLKHGHYLTNSHNWTAEDGSKWMAGDDARFFYDGREMTDLAAPAPAVGSSHPRSKYPRGVRATKLSPARGHNVTRVSEPSGARASVSGPPRGRLK